MHPAYSVILFTTASGAGYGLLILLAVLAVIGELPPERWLGFTGLAAALALITVGLLSSAFHLGRPERAWRAYSQWRTSWLSREGVVATATYLPAGLFAIGWVVLGSFAPPWSTAGVVSALLAVATVYCTGMIYASLTTIPQWHHPLVVPVYLLLALASGALLINVVLGLFGHSTRLSSWIALGSLLAGFVVKLGYWRGIDTAPRRHSAGDATGLGRVGTVRPLDPPHTQPNFVMREMGYAIARKHARRLRLIAVALLFAAPFALTAAALAVSGPPAALFAALALLSAAPGIVIERWLFFAEARHVVTLYYGAEEA